METTIIMTIICLIILLEILQQCNIAGFNGADLGKRAGLISDMKKKGKKDKRRAFRSGMGNNEDSFESEYDDEYDYYEEQKSVQDVEDSEDIEEEEEEEEEYYDEESEEEETKRGKSSLKKQLTKQKTLDKVMTPSSIMKSESQNNENAGHLEMLEQLAQ